ncbi:carnitine 3-dehydrogenase [Mesorhizobium sp. J428]|uniref:carnitine 3-dehydrogenase n=1 Tax=Mesorhizobium sp. J428 TaxID=2898440 RepID=UPI002150EB2F|nr:carnitine 3-dehydrogenase [Mesorhizobium sp. J428]MCR5856155.1 carnitine 3-dehydrogenase [Mesorhizobium sp. J428]
MTITKAACIGGGVIGAGWVARLVLNGIDVAVFDPDPEAKRKVDEVMKGARRAYRRMATAGLPKEGKITYARTIAEAVADADFIQESVPERLDLKHRVLAEIDAHAPSSALVGSSTSGIKPTDMQVAMKKHPERLVVGHPFNPVYLLPIVEIVGGEQTWPEAIELARDYYAGIGMKPVVIRKEIEAFVGDRLLEAMWREALWLIKDGICTVEELDDIMRYGFGLRWAQMGMFQVYRIAGGEAGMRHFMAQFGPCLSWPWTKLMDVPEFNDELVDLIASQSDDQSSQWSIRELEKIRDENLIGIMEALAKADKGKGWGAGELHKTYVKQLGKGAKAKVSKAAEKAKATKPKKVEAKKKRKG